MKCHFSSQAYQGAQQISSNANNQFKSQILQNRRRSGNNIPTDANLQQILQLGGAPTGDTGFALNNDISNYNWNNYATPQRVQCAPSQAQNFYNSMNSFGDSPGPNTFNNVITAMQQWNAATPVNNG